MTQAGYYTFLKMVKMISLNYVDLKFVDWLTDKFYLADEDFLTSSKKRGMNA